MGVLGNPGFTSSSDYHARLLLHRRWTPYLPYLHNTSGTVLKWDGALAGHRGESGIFHE